MVRLLAGNLLIFLVIVWSLNLVAAGFLDARYLLRRLFLPTDSRVELPNFENKARAKLIFDEVRQLRTQYVPYVAWSRRETRGETVTVDARGDRVHRTTTDAPRAHVRFFGGSTVWGTGVDDEGTIPARFNALHPEVRVHNHGESSFVSRQSTARLVNLVSQSAPMDLVIFYDGYNDVRTLCRRDVGLTGHAREQQLQRIVNPVSRALDALTEHLRRVLGFLIRSAKGTHYEASRCIQDPSYAERVARTLVRNWRIAREIARFGGAEFLAILQPVAAIGSPRLDHLADDAFSLDDYSTARGASRKLLRGRDHKIVYPVIQSLLEREGAAWIHDLTDVFDVDEYVYMGPSHVTENGNALVAERISAIAQDLLPARRRIASSASTRGS